MTLALAITGFTTFVSAQETPKQEDSMQKQERRERKGFGGKRDGSGKGMRGGKHGGGDRMLMRSLGRLNLTDAQKAQTRSVLENFKNTTQTQREEMRGLAMKKRDGIITADEQNRLKEIKTQMRASGEQMHTSVLAILTAEQRTQLDQMKEEMKQKMQERRQNRQNRTAPPTEDNQ